MTKEQLQDRIEKKEQEIAKIEKRIQKWTTGMNDEAKAVAAACELVYDDPKYKEAYKAYDEYKKSHEKDPTVYRQDYEWNKGPNIGEAYSAYRDLAEAKATLNKYKVEIDKLTNFENEEKIPVIWEFLQKWRQMSYDYYVEQAQELKRLEDNYQKEFEKHKNTIDYEDNFNYYKTHGWQDWRIKYELENRFRRNYYSGIDSLTYNISRHGKVDEDKLNKHLDAEVRRKYNKLVNDVTAKAGEIKDASNLKVNARGEISGIINGTKNDVELWLTFVPGEVQCPHYRGYCNIVKK